MYYVLVTREENPGFNRYHICISIIVICYVVARRTRFGSRRVFIRSPINNNNNNIVVVSARKRTKHCRSTDVRVRPLVFGSGGRDDPSARDGEKRSKPPRGHGAGN